MKYKRQIRIAYFHQLKITFHRKCFTKWYRSKWEQFLYSLLSHSSLYSHQVRKQEVQLECNLLIIFFTFRRRFELLGTIPTIWMCSKMPKKMHSLDRTRNRMPRSLISRLPARLRLPRRNRFDQPINLCRNRVGTMRRSSWAIKITRNVDKSILMAKRSSIKSKNQKVNRILFFYLSSSCI